MDNKILKTLRDDFAMAALNGTFVRCYLNADAESPTKFRLETTVQLAYMIADAMLEARKAEGE